MSEEASKAKEEEVKGPSKDTAAAAANDGDLSDLLDEALKDFGSSNAQSKDAGNVLPTGLGLNPSELAAFGPGSDQPHITPEMAQRAAADFHNMLLQLSKVQEATLQNQPADATGESLGGPDVEGPQSQEEADAFLKSLNELASRAQRVATAQSAEEFVSRMDELQEEPGNDELMPFMQGLMSSLMSKDVMYPSLKEMIDKYPEYLSAHDSELSAEDKTRFTEQLKIMQRLCELYEVDEATLDTEQKHMEHFEKIMVLMQQMQMCGHPPAELVGAMPPGWQLDQSTGMPQVVDSQAAAESCSIM